MFPVHLTGVVPATLAAVVGSIGLSVASPVEAQPVAAPDYTRDASWL